MLAGRRLEPNAPREFPMLLSKYVDRVAITLSTICIVHCLADRKSVV